MPLIVNFTLAAPDSAQSYGCGPLPPTPPPKKNVGNHCSSVRCVCDVVVPVLTCGHTNRERSLMDINDVNVACTEFWGRTS